MKPEHILIIALVVIVLLYLTAFILVNKKTKKDKFDKIPFVFYMHGKRFTPEEASEYYDIQKTRSIDPYLMIYDTELKEYFFKDRYSIYESEFVNPKDRNYDE